MENSDKKFFCDNNFPNKKSDIFSQFLRYCVVGGIAYSVDFLSLFALTEYLNIYYLLSASIAFLFGLTLNYILSISWVFNNRKVKNRVNEFTIFAIIGVVGLFLNYISIWFFTEITDFHYLISKVFSTAFVFTWNFLARKFILFN